MRARAPRPEALHVDADEAARARDALHALAQPRLTGSPGAHTVAAELRRRFEELGYQIRELGFSFSTLPGRFGLPAAALLYFLASLAAALWLTRARTQPALLALLALAAAVAILAGSARTAIGRLPWGRTHTENWLVHRPGARPRFLLVAHRDSKSQLVPSLLRSAAVALALGAWAILVIVAVLANFFPAAAAPAMIWLAVTPGLGAALLLMLCWSGNRSPGALDNGTGLATLLALARRERRDDVAFLVTDGEELGLAGAWAVARHVPAHTIVINLDGIDDDGDFYLIERFGWPRRGLAPQVAAALLEGALQLDYPVVRRDLPFGILVDHIPFIAAGRSAVTLMRGSLRSLQRVHRPADRAQTLNGTGVAAAAALVGAALRILRGEPSADPRARAS